MQIKLQTKNTQKLDLTITLADKYINKVSVFSVYATLIL
jgi:hypothetical protein